MLQKKNHEHEYSRFYFPSKSDAGTHVGAGETTTDPTAHPNAW